MAFTIKAKQFLAKDLGGIVSDGGKRLKEMFFTVDFDSSYPTGGEPLDLSGDFKDLLFVHIEPKSGYIFEYDYTSKKVLAYWNDADAGADAALIEVADTTDLSALTGVRVLARGY